MGCNHHSKRRVWKEVLLVNEIEAPFSFDLSAPSSLPWKLSEGVCSRLIRLSSGRLLLVCVKSIGTCDRPKLEVALMSKFKLSEKDKMEVAGKISHIFGLRDNIRDFYSLAENDPVLRQVIQHFYGMRGPSEPRVFETIVISILEQQVNLKSAGRLRERLIDKFGEKLKLSNQTYHAFPTPEELAKADISQLRACGLSRYKASYIRGISESIVKGEFQPEELSTLSNEQVVEALMRLKGIGRWSAEYILVRGLGRPVVPGGDLAVRRAISEFYFNSKELSSDHVRRFSQRWGNYKGLAVFYLLCAYREGKRPRAHL